MDQAVHQEDIVTPSSKQKDMDIPGCCIIYDIYIFY